MRPIDLLTLALAALWQQKMRTALTLLGVVVGSFILVMCLSVGQGLREAIERQYSFGNQLRLIGVRPGHGEPELELPPEKLNIAGQMSDAKRRRLQQAVKEEWRMRHYRPRNPLDVEALNKLSQLDHVERVTPVITAYLQIQLGGKTEHGRVAGAPADDQRVKRQIVAGAGFARPGQREVLIHEYLLYKFGIADDADVEAAIGKKIRIEYRPRAASLAGVLQFAGDDDEVRITPDEAKLLDETLSRLAKSANKLDLSSEEIDVFKKAFGRPPPDTSALPQVALSEEFTIVGVFRSLSDDERESSRWFVNYEFADGAHVVLPTATAQTLAARLPYHKRWGFDTAIVLVDEQENVKPVAQQIEAMGLGQRSLVAVIERIQRHAALVTYSMAVLAAIALLVSALGITNTMVMSVLERTREIGVMKAVGGRDSHIMLMFLVEGALLGLLGGALGLLAARLAAWPANILITKLLREEFGRPVDESLFVYPLWLCLGAPLFSAAITTAAALYPARRAARTDPISALRHE